MKVVAIIPARYESTRLPGKALLDIAGKPMIQWVYERASRAEHLARVIVATDDERILRTVRDFGGEAALTAKDHPSGTDRIAEVAAKLDAQVIVNVQGDEPLIDPRAIDLAVEPFLRGEDVVMTTLMCPIRAEELDDPHTVKVVVDQQGFALYFSRAAIPSTRSGRAPLELVRKHIGLYAYTREFLLRYAALPPTPLMQAEQLEQLKVLEHGFRIRVLETELESIGVDTAEDLERVRRIVAGEEQ